MTAGTLIHVVDTRLQVLQVAGQEVLTSDGLSIKLTLAGTYGIEDVEKYLLGSQMPAALIYGEAQQVLRDLVAGVTLEALLQTRAELNEKMLGVLAPRAAVLGMSLKRMEVRDVLLPGDLRRAFAQALAAQREGVAKLEHARSEVATLRALANSARMLAETPGLLQLRALQAVEASRETRSRWSWRTPVRVR